MKETHEKFIKLKIINYKIKILERLIYFRLFLHLKLNKEIDIKKLKCFERKHCM